MASYTSLEQPSSSSFIASKPVKIIGLVAAFALVGVAAVSVFSKPKSTSTNTSAIDGSSKLELESGSCPVLVATKDFDINKYMGHWYTIQEIPTTYVPEGATCVTATYKLLTPTSVQVDNECILTSGKQNGGILSAVVRDSSYPSKLDVGPTFLPSFLYGDYWVLDHAADYSWALISGGQSTKGLFGSTCKVSGLWIFARTQTIPDELKTELRNKLTAMGLNLDQLKLADVLQGESCKYSGY